jgi:amidase
MAAAGADTVRVNIADFDSLLANTSVINLEHKYDMIDYLARTPNARVKSIADILATGLESGALEARLRLADSMGTRDSERYRRALARQTVARERIVAIMDSLRVDALVYPTMRRTPVLVGDPQLGSTCGLSAQTGLPALTVPAGFTANGLPVGIELIGRPFSDVRLVALGYAFEQLGPRRRAPFTTPALVNGKARGPVTFSASGAASRGTFTYDRLTGVLRYDVRVTGRQPARVQAVVLRRRDAAGRARVVHTMSGPAVPSAAGTTTLGAIDREALANGHLVLSLVMAGEAPIDTPLVLPR